MFYICSFDETHHVKNSTDAAHRVLSELNLYSLGHILFKLDSQSLMLLVLAALPHGPQLASSSSSSKVSTELNGYHLTWPGAAVKYSHLRSYRDDDCEFLDVENVKVGAVDIDSSSKSGIGLGSS